MKINPQPLTGDWHSGFALDLHTLSSVPKEWSTKKVTVEEVVDGKRIVLEKIVEDKNKVTKWETTYTDIGLEMNHLKYWHEPHRAQALGTVAADFLKVRMSSRMIHLIVPIPPSDTTRTFQPVYEIVNHMGRICNLPVEFGILRKLRSTSQLKGIVDPEERKEILKGVFSIQNGCLKNKNVLIFDDLYRSGETIGAACRIISGVGGARCVYVLTVTKTRVKR